MREIAVNPKARAQLTPEKLPTQAKERLEWATQDHGKVAILLNTK
jgi:hypothetical protein